MTPYAETGDGGGSNGTTKPLTIPTTNNNNNNNTSTNNNNNNGNNTNNSNTSSSSSSSSNGKEKDGGSSGTSTTLNGSGGINANPSTSPPLADIEQYLNAYSNDLPELIVAACWWADSLAKLNTSLPKENIKKFRKELINGLRDRVKGHWYPESPDRGQGYRAVVCEETTDRLLLEAARRSDISGDFRSLFKQNTTMWVDPGNVTYRHGKHYEKTLYPFNLSKENGSAVNTSSNNTITNNTNNTNNLNNNIVNNITNLNTSINSSGGFAINNSILTNVINQTPPRSSSGLSNTNPNNVTRVSSPSLSSHAPVFSPSSPNPLVYHHLISNQSPPASPVKDNTNNNVYSYNRTPIKLYQQYS